MADHDYSASSFTTLPIGLHVRVCSDDEWDGLIGIIDDFLDQSLNSIESCRPGCKCLVYFPISRRRLEDLNMVGVNDYPMTVLADLRSGQNRKVFELKELQEVDPENI